MFKLSRARVDAKQRVNRALGRYGVQMESVRVIEHLTRKAYLKARKEASSKEKTGKLSSLVLRALYRITPANGGFVDIRTGEVHLHQKTGTVTRLHETVHGSDLNQPEITRLAREMVEEESRASIFRPIEYVKFKLKEIRLVALIEGRAKFCERIASKDKEFTLWERLRFKISRNSEAAALVVAGYLTVHIAVGAMGGPHSLFFGALDGVAILLGTWATVKLTPYVLGMRFMEYVEKKVEDIQKSLEITAKELPSLKELIFPKRYLEKLEKEQNSG